MFRRQDVEARPEEVCAVCGGTFFGHIWDQPVCVTHYNAWHDDPERPRDPPGPPPANWRETFEADCQREREAAAAWVAKKRGQR